MASKSKLTPKVHDLDRGWKGLVAEFRRVREGTATIGLHAAKDGLRLPEESPSGPYEDGTTVIDVGFWHEFGTPNADPPLPARSFLRATMDENKAKYGAAQVKLMGEVVDLKIPAREALATLGLMVTSDVRNRIARNRAAPPSKPATLARKGRTRPVTLFDSGRLFNSINFKINLGAV